MIKQLLIATVLLCIAASPAQAKYFDIQQITSPEGVNFWFVEDHSAPTVALRFLAHGGSISDPEDRQGRANLISTLLDEGAGERDPYEFQRDLRNFGIKLSFSAGRDSFNGSLTTVTAYKQTAFEMMRDALTVPRFEESAIARMKAAISSQIRFQQSNPIWHAKQALFKQIYGDHPYARSPEGTIESVESITKEDLESYLKNYLTQDNLIIGLAGDLSVIEAAELVDLVFSKLPKHGERVNIPAVDLQLNGLTHHVEWDGPQAVVTFAHKGLAREDEDWFTARILDHILGSGGFTARLTEELRVTRGLTYGISTALVDYDYGPLYLGQASVKADSVEQVQEIIAREFTRLKGFGVTEAEVKTAKAYINGSLPLAISSNGAVARLLVQMQDDNLPIDYLNYRERYVNSVSPNHINAFANQWLQSEQLTYGVAGGKLEQSKQEENDE